MAAENLQADSCVDPGENRPAHLAELVELPLIYRPQLHEIKKNGLETNKELQMLCIEARGVSSPFPHNSRPLPC